MSQNSLVLPTTGTVSGLQMTQNINYALDTLNTLCSGAAAPGTPEAGQFWHDTTNNILKLRSLDNMAWISLFKLDEAGYQALLSNSSYNQGGFVNKFHNPIHDIAQRGNSVITVTTSGGYVTDGWIVTPSGASCTAQQSASNPRAGRLSTYSLLLTGATGVTDIALKQRIESLIAQPLAGQQVTVQAQVYNNTGSSITPTLTVKRPTATDNYTSVTVDVSAVNLQSCANGAWTLVSYTFACNAGAGAGLEVTIDFGNSFSTTGKSVQVTELDIRATPGVATGLNGTPPVPEIRPIHAELAFCQRYFFSTFPPGVAPAQNAGSTGCWNFNQIYSNNANNQSTGDLRFATQMRAAPTVITYNPSNANAQPRNFTRGTDCTGAALGQSSVNTVTFTYTTASTSSVGDANGLHITATAEL